MSSANDETSGKTGSSVKPLEFDEWVINVPDNIRIIGCGDFSNLLIPKIYEEYPEKMKGIQYRIFNKPTKPDYLDLRLTPDFRNIRGADVKKGVQLKLDKKDGEIEKTSVLTKIKSFIGSRQKNEKTNGNMKNGEQGRDETGGAIEEQGSNNKHPESSSKPMDNNSFGDQRDLKVKIAKEELEKELLEFLPNTDLLFVISDFKSNFGLDNSQIVAKVARDKEIITVALVVLPTHIERLEDVENGNRALQSLRLKADIVVVIPQLEHIISGYIVLIISELLELMTTSGLVNLDVADVKNVVAEGNVAMLGFGSGRGTEQDKILGAINEVVTSPLLNIELDGVTRTLVNVVGDSTMTVMEAQKAAKMILERIQPGARLIWGARINPKLAGAVKVMVMIGVKPKNILVHIYANS